jgi:hypothetical protein
MDVGNGIALVAALIALIALWFAQRSAKASEDSASAAVRSAAASETVRLAKAARDRKDRPSFELSACYLRNELCQVTIKMIDGPPRIEVSADHIAESESRDIPIPDGSGYARAVNLTAGSSNKRVLLRCRPQYCATRPTASVGSGTTSRAFAGLVLLPPRRGRGQRSRWGRVSALRRSGSWTHALLSRTSDRT